jgi:hypothetical protein
MALTNTITTFRYNPFTGKQTDITPGWERLQTTASKTTLGAFNIFASATASDDFILDSVLVNLSLASGNADVVLYGGTDALCQFATQGATSDIATFSVNFGHGLTVGTTTTGTVSMAIATASCTARFVALGWRKK